MRSVLEIIEDTVWDRDFRAIVTATLSNTSMTGYTQLPDASVTASFAASVADAMKAEREKRK